MVWLGQRNNQGNNVSSAAAAAAGNPKEISHRTDKREFSFAKVVGLPPLS
jgi:hypothetical protein